MCLTSELIKALWEVGGGFMCSSSIFRTTHNTTAELFKIELPFQTRMNLLQVLISVKTLVSQNATSDSLVK